MKFAILGCGSIGERHLRNLLQMGHSVVVQEPDATRLSTIKKKYGVEGSVDAEQVLSWGGDAALVCSPSVYHLSQATMVLQHGMHLFVEKPLSHTLKGLTELVHLAKQADRTVLVACNLRFYPSLMLVKRLMDEGKVGRPLIARVHGGFYLPYWRPNTDYRKGYGARSELGGGVILDFIHDLDYLYWLFGMPQQVFCWADKASNLEIDTEDMAAMQFKYANGMVAQLQFDYLRPTYQRGMEVIGEEGAIIWDYTSATTRLYDRENNQFRTYLENINTEINSMYLEEMNHFGRCIQGLEQPMVDLSKGRAVVELAEAAKRSAHSNQVVHVPLEDLN